MRFKTLECVVLARDVPEHGLQKGDVGAVVETMAPDGLEVEFVAASGETIALLTLSERDVRHAGKDDILAARPAKSA
jgi:hypothetical protein